MSFINFFKNGVDFNPNYARANYPADSAEAMVPTHKFEGKVTKSETEVNRIDGAIFILSGVSDKVRNESIAVWQTMSAKSLLTTLGSVVVLAGGAALASTAASTAFVALGVVIAVAGLALTIFGAVRTSSAAKELDLWKDPVPYAAQIRRSIPTKPLTQIIPLVGKYIHQLELEEIFFKRTGGTINRIQEQLGRVNLPEDKVQFVIDFFNNNPLNHINEVFPGVTNQGQLKVVVACSYDSMKDNFEALRAATKQKLSAIEADKKAAIQKLDRILEGKLQPLRTPLDVMKSTVATCPKHLLEKLKADIKQMELRFEAAASPHRQAHAAAVAKVEAEAEPKIKKAKKGEETAFLELYGKFGALAEDLTEALHAAKSKSKEEVAL